MTEGNHVNLDKKLNHSFRWGERHGLRKAAALVMKHAENDKDRLIMEIGREIADMADKVVVGDQALPPPVRLPFTESEAALHRSTGRQELDIDFSPG